MRSFTVTRLANCTFSECLLKLSGRAILLGYSSVRGTDRRLCGSKQDSRMVCCFPGARPRMSWRGGTTFSRRRVSSQKLMCMLVQMTWVGKGKILQNEYRKLGKRLKSRTSLIVISGLLPVPCSHASGGRNRKIGQWISGIGCQRRYLRQGL